jgi:serine/threonine protein kinase
VSRDMTPERWRQVTELFHAALTRTESARARYLDQVCAGDTALRAEVDAMLAVPSETASRDAIPLKGSATTTSQPGTMIGPYRIECLIGAGGMGEVYRARDTKLGRDVAIKIVPRAFTSDPERLARFDREARVLASLNHPHIAAIHGIEDAPVDGDAPVRALILELIEGDTLAERIAHRGSRGLPIKEALDTARQIADALDAAHERGIIHRDLKPANIKITPQGVVKVLDFGLAKAATGGGATFDLTQSPTVTIGGTREGVILGTAAYMSPEQARGRPVDKRADIWAFGCMLYEMLTGRLAFPGETVSDTIAAILGRELDWNALPDGTPTGIRRLLQRCLDKDPRRRQRDIGDARIELEETLSASPELPTSTSARNSRYRRTSWPFTAAIAALSALIATVAVWNLKPAPATAPEPEARFTLPMPAGVELVLGGFGSMMSVSPDGKRLAFVGRRGTTQQLYLRTLQDAATRVLSETEGAAQPFFSPDSRWLAFFAGGKLKKVPADGGVPMVICDAPASRGGFWSENGAIVFSPLARGSGIFRVFADGGTAKQITTLNPGEGETSHRLPELLPGGETVLFAAYGATYQDVSIVAQSLKTGERRVLLEGASQPRYISTGHLLYVQPKRPGTVMAVAFDADRLQITSTPAPVVEGVLTDRGDQAQFSVSQLGMLVYAPGGFREAENNLVFVDRKGLPRPLGLLRDGPIPSLGFRRMAVELW